MAIRRASDSEAGELSRLAIAAKAHWGYAQELLREWRPQLSITRKDIRSRPTFVITVHGSIAGFYSLQPGAEAWKLEHLWVRPGFVGRGPLDRGRGSQRSGFLYTLRGNEGRGSASTDSRRTGPGASATEVRGLARAQAHNSHA